MPEAGQQGLSRASAVASEQKGMVGSLISRAFRLGVPGFRSLAQGDLDVTLVAREWCRTTWSCRTAVIGDP